MIPSKALYNFRVLKILDIMYMRSQGLIPLLWDDLHVALSEHYTDLSEPNIHLQSLN